MSETCGSCGYRAGHHAAHCEAAAAKANLAALLEARDRIARLEAVAEAAAKYNARSHHVDKCPIRYASARPGSCECGKWALTAALDAMTNEEIKTMFKEYRRKQIAELRPYEPGEALEAVSVSDADRKAGSPKSGDMIARNPKNHHDQWLVAAAYFGDNFEPIA